MKIHQGSVSDVLASIRSSTEGLSSAEARRRLREFGENSVEKVAGESFIVHLLKEFAHFFSVILWIAAALAFFAEWNVPGQGMARIGYAIIAVILVSGVFSFWQEYRIEQTIAALQKLLPQQVQTLRDGDVIQLPIEHLVPGDIVLLEQGNNIPADCRLIDAFGLRVNNATVTGESAPKARDGNPSQEENAIDARNILLAGTSLVSGHGKAVVFSTGARTEFGKIAHLTQTAGEPVSPLRKELAHLSRLIALLAVVIAVVFFAIGEMLGVPFWQGFIFSIGIIVAMVPEGLLPTLTLALVLAAQRMARRHVLIRHLPSVETLGSATVICTDKTGTLTENRMHVQELLLGLERHSAATLEDEIAEHHSELFAAAKLCHDLKETTKEGKSVLQGDPMEIALVEMAGRLMPGSPSFSRLDEIPFDTDRMRQSVVIDAPGGPVLYCKGAPESVLPLCDRIQDTGQTRRLDAESVDTIVRAQEAMASRGLRVLAFAFRVLPPDYQGTALEQELCFCGLVGLEDPPRAEVPEAIRKCHKAGIRVIIVTGDHPHTATAIAREIGLIQSSSPLIVTGDQLQKLSSIQLQLALDSPEILFARVAADQKMRIVEALKNKKHVVAVTGDGVNDAPALKAAHIGIAMGISGTDVAKEAADMVLLDDNFASIVNAVEEGRAVFQNIRKFLTYVLVHNVAELVPYLAFAVFRIPLPLMPIQALIVDMGTDSLTALGLGVEKPDPELMRRPPRQRNERLLSLPLALRAYLFLGMIEAAAAMAAFFYVLDSAGWKYGQALAASDPIYLSATTATLSAIIVMQIVNVFLCRSSIRSIFSTGLFGNRLIIWGVALEIVLILLIDYTPWGNSVVDTASIAAEVWLFVLPFAAAMLVLEELRKWFVRRHLSQGPPQKA